MRTERRINMHTVTYFLIWMGCSLSLNVFSFILGRCARRIPLIDDCMVPWVMHRGAISSGAKSSRTDASLESPDHPRPVRRETGQPSNHILHAYTASALDSAVPR